MSNRGTGSENENGMETAIELPLDLPRRRERNLIEKTMDGMIYWCLLFTSEGALTLYILFHWLLGCASHIVVSGDKKSGGDENASFFSFIYFMSTLVAFLSIMSHVSGLLIPLFAFSAFGAFFLFFLINLAVLEHPEAKTLFFNICSKSNVTIAFHTDMEDHPTATIIKTWILIAFFVLTCASILFQCARNEEYLRRPQPVIYPGFYPHMLPREMPVGPSNLDEPPRYSTLEPMSSPKSTVTRSSTVTSPPRYSYWERTFGRARTSSQSSEQSNREMMTAKSH
ncbi:hypothetical protein CRE_02847 [Caenorhabditis remanei]|uniref:Uncharacterized protein n=1 Tax=Caenorhabditis remanei TaxID=31234 RepID=E3LW75_CAERE|nr:hypothetical protein CRE_02847 [Caenorhabditis remanei]